MIIIITKHDTGHMTSTVSTCINSCHAAAGSCGITANTMYDVYLVAQDFITPTPNLQTSPTQGLLNTSDTSGDFSCTAGIFTSMLKPYIVPVGSSPGSPTSQLYGNWSATRCAMQNMSVFERRWQCLADLVVLKANSNACAWFGCAKT